MIRKILLFLLAALIIIQFFHPKKNIAKGPQANYIGNAFAIPEDVKSIMAKACNDCHSNNTRYPWYFHIQPVHWWLNGHINKGKKGLNFDDYTNRPLRFQYKRMEDVADLVKDGEMPLKTYRWIHKDAKLTKEEKDKIIAWAGSVQDELRARYPIDSLVRPKK